MVDDMVIKVTAEVLYMTIVQMAHISSKMAGTVADTHTHTHEASYLSESCAMSPAPLQESVLHQAVAVIHNDEHLLG